MHDCTHTPCVRLCVLHEVVLVVRVLSVPSDHMYHVLHDMWYHYITTTSSHRE